MWPSPIRMWSISTRAIVSDGGVRLIELDIPDAPGPAEQPGGIEVDIQPLETRQRRAVLLGQLETVHGGFQSEGIEFDVPHAQLAGELVLADPGQQLLHQKVDQKESEDQIQSELPGRDQERQAQGDFDDASP